MDGIRSRSRAWMRFAVPTVVVALLLAGPTPAQAAIAPTGAGYVWAYDEAIPIGSTYTPITMRYNSTGALNTVTHTATGRYTVHFTNLNMFGTAVVTANNVTPGHEHDLCYVSAMPWTSTGQDVVVACHDATGRPADNRFTITYAMPGPYNPNAPPPQGVKRAYVFADAAETTIGATTTPALAYQYNSTGVANTLVRTGLGRYSVTLPGMGDAITSLVTGQAHVTAYGDGGTFANSCAIDAISSDPLSRTVRVDVMCRVGDDWHWSINSRFLLQYVSGGSLLYSSSGVHPHGYARVICLATGCAIQRSSTNPLVTVSAIAVGPGEFRVVFPLDVGGGTFNVSAVGHGVFIRCKVRSWGPTDGVRVVCFDQMGNPPVSVEAIVSFVS